MLRAEIRAKILWPAGLLTGVLTVGLVGSAAAAGRLAWSRPVAVDQRAPFSNPRPFTGVSCASVKLCVAVAARGRLVITTAPGSGRSRWRALDVDHARTASGTAQLTAVSCPSSSFCAAVDDVGHVITSTRPTGGAAEWRSRLIDTAHTGIYTAQLTGISCPSARLCVAVDNAGYELTSRDPAARRSSWHERLVDTPPSPSSNPLDNIRGHQLTGISCASSRLCVALDRAGSVVTSSDPGAEHAHWRYVRFDPATHQLLSLSFFAAGISCPTVALCVIAGGRGVVWSRSPAGGAAAWRGAVLEPNPFPSGPTLNGITCASASMCAAIDVEGNAFVSGDPSGGSGAWKSGLVDPGAMDPLPAGVTPPAVTGVACPSRRLCVAVDFLGDVVWSASPLAGASTWRVRNVQAGYNPIASLVCPSASLCVGASGLNHLLASTHPAAAPSAWRSFAVGQGAASVSCLSTSFCYGVSGSELLFSSRSPAGGPGQWSVTAIGGPNRPYAVSCPSRSLCVAVEGNGEIATSTDPQAGAGAWKAVSADTAVGPECGKYGPGDGCDPGLSAISCPTVAFCAASDQQGNVITTRDPTGSAAAWTTTSLSPDFTFGQVMCPAATSCVWFDGSSRVLVSSDPGGGGRAWHALSLSDSGLASLSCRSATLCVAADSGGDVIAFDPLTRAHKLEPIDPSSTFAVDSTLSVDCTPHGRCTAFDRRGNVFTSEDPFAGTSSWSRAHVDSAAIVLATCPSTKVCLAADQYGEVIVGRATPLHEPKLR